MFRLRLPALAAAALLAGAVAAHAQTGSDAGSKPPVVPAPSSQEAADVQILLDRVNFSPGLVDGSFGDNTHKALAAFQEAHDLPVTGEVDAETWRNLLAASGGNAWILYTVSVEDAAGPFFQIPADMMQRAKLPGLGYASAADRLAARFHTSEALLRQRNPAARFAPGESLLAPNVRRQDGTTSSLGESVRVVVSRSRGTLIVDNGDDLLFFAPVSAGSQREPLPIGTWQVRGVERNPVYQYDPPLFWQPDAKKAKAHLAAGPYNPVGAVWIDLSKERYGIHGTPEPGKVGSEYEHGCVRLTNWDALTVASLVRPGTQVVFEP
jgi:lipoprotein-anchoring transpeptidase ErfK/SrfK